MTTIQRTIEEEAAGGGARGLATSASALTAPQLRKMARDLRECAKVSRWPDFAERLIRAAESLEVQAAELEAGYSMASNDKANLPIYY